MSISARVPTRGAMMPAIGATIIGASVHGVVWTAASSGVEPCTTCMYWIRMKTAPNVPKLNAKPTMFVVEKERSRNSRSGMSGALARACQAMKATRSATPATISAMTLTDDQPSSLPRTMAWTRARTLTAASTAPTTSMRARAPKSLLSTKNASGIAMIATGTLIQKIACQFQPSMTAPPTSGPTATPRPAMPPQRPMASGRRSGATPPAMRASDSGMTPAPPKPCSARAAIELRGIAC